MTAYRGTPGFTDHGPFPAHVDFPTSGHTNVCRACSYSNDGTTLTPVPWPCGHESVRQPALLAAAVTARREQLGYTKTQLATLAGVGLRSVHLVEDGAATQPREATLAGLERALRWAPGSAVQVLAGGEPTLVAVALGADVPAEVEAVLLGCLPHEVEQALLAHVAARRQAVEVMLRDEAVILVDAALKLSRET